MRYLGGKVKLAKNIVEVIKQYKFNTYVEPFCGGCAVIEKLDLDIPKIANDVDTDLINLFLGLQAGWIPPDDITEVEYNNIKNNISQYNPALVGFTAFCCSFGGKKWGGYARSSNDRNYCLNGKNSLLKATNNLSKVNFISRSYKELDIPKDSLIYCDPPYTNTTGYSHTFNNNEFWTWVREQSKTNVVLISEYTAPDDFECIWAKDISIGLSGKIDRQNNQLKTEKLFKLKEQKTMINLNSSQQLSMIFFGGQQKAKEDQPILNELGLPEVYKSGVNKGKQKTKKVEVFRRIKGLGLKPLKEWKTKKDGIYSTGDDVLQTIISWFQVSQEEIDIGTTHPDALIAGRIAELLLRSRGLQKQISTYYEGLEELIYPDGCVHTQFQSVLTPTKRLSSTKPNIQNQPGKPFKAKEHFGSRFEKGRIINSDYKQIEVVIFAVLSADIILINLLKSGVDLYKYLAAIIFDIPIEQVDKETQRDKTKIPALGMIYGNGAQTMSKNANMPEQWCKDFIKTFYETFPIAKDWHKLIQEQVNETGRLKTFTGAEYRFKKYPAKYEWQIKQGIIESYNPPDIKNHPVQGTAFDIVIIMIGRFWRNKALHSRDKYLMINTIHDSLMIDCRQEYKKDCINDMQELVKVKDMCYTVFNYKIPLDVRQDISIGKNWYSLLEVKI